MMPRIRNAVTLVAVTMTRTLASPAASRAQDPEDEVQTPETSSSAQQPAPESPQAQTPPEEETQKIPDEDVREQTRPIMGSELEDADLPGSWPMFGENTRMKVGGDVKADFLLRLRRDPRPDAVPDVDDTGRGHTGERHAYVVFGNFLAGHDCARRGRKQW